MKSQPCASLVFAVLSAAPLSAGSFVNLGFDDPDLSHAVPTGHFPALFAVPTSEALRGWRLTADIYNPSTVLITPAGASQPPIDLTGAFSFPGTGVDFGKNLIYFNNDIQTPDSFRPVYHLSQSGTIPAGATQLIYYRAGPTLGVNPFQILVNGKPVPYTEAGISYADVSAFAGQQVSLEFVFPKGNNFFDIAGFNIVPEPSTYALLGLGAAALGWQCRRRPHS